MSVDRREVIGALAALPLLAVTAPPATRIVLLAGEAVVGKDLMEV